VNQYSLVQRAEAFGWPRDRIRVIDADLGLSGRGSEYRTGFKELAGDVSLGHVGIIFSFEVSRLARNNSDWYYLLDLAALFGTLIADDDGVYDPRLFNDRLLLGLKGTMSEAELHLLRLRLDAGRMSQVRRGAYRQHLPTGLVRLSDGRVVKDPDDQIRHVIELVLTKFEETGNCRQVLRYLRHEQILLPRRQTAGLYKGQLLWKVPSDAAIYDILRNPAYAGAFAYGRCQSDPTLRQPGRPAVGRVRKPMAEWIHLQMDVYPAYIAWEQYLVNQERLHENAMRFDRRIAQAQGSPGRGTALLQGMVVCGDCGCRMYVGYKHSSHHYFCNALNKRFGKPMCAYLSGAPIDEVVVQAFFEALRPAQLDALEAVLASQQAERERLSRQWEERLKRARYEAHLAERQYDAVDPENRLVAAELERRWEEKLSQLQTAQEAYDRFQQAEAPATLSPEVREQLRHISETLPELWRAGQVSNAQKKELLRCLVSQVILRKSAPDTVEIKVIWVSGHYSVFHARLPVNQQESVTGLDEMIARLRALWQQGLNDDQIAAQLLSEGFHTARSARGVSPMTVQKIRLERGWYQPLHRSRNALELDGHLTIRGLAARLEVKRSWVYNRIRSGVIHPAYVVRHPQSQLCLIRNSPELTERLRQLLPGKPRAEGGI
jgi:DNA invertase Pin-like site-specific DNA recombinase